MSCCSTFIFRSRTNHGSVGLVIVATLSPHRTRLRPMDPIIAATHANPYPYYAQLRAEGGLVFHQGLKLWLASSARTVAAVLTHPGCHVRPAHEPVPKAIADGIAGQVFGRLMRMNEGEKQRCPRAAIEP